MSFIERIRTGSGSSMTYHFAVTDRNRPAWPANFKQTLLANFVRTRYARQTTLSQLLTGYQVIDDNVDGVLDALERRHLVSWHDLCTLYAHYANMFCNTAIAKIDVNSDMGSSLRYLFKVVLGDRQESQLYTAGMTSTANRFAGALSSEKSRLNASENNVFIGPARNNRSIGRDFDRAIEFVDPRDHVVNRRQVEKLRACWLILKPLVENDFGMGVGANEPRRSSRISMQTDEN